MKHLIRLLVSLVVPALMLAGVVAGPVMAQDKGKDMKAAPAAKAEKGKSALKVILENDKVRVFQRTYKPGDLNEEVPSSSNRVVHTVKGGTLERTFADGKKEKYDVKNGEVRYLEAAKTPGGKYTVKNVGKTEIVNVVVLLK